MRALALAGVVAFTIATGLLSAQATIVVTGGGAALQQAISTAAAGSTLDVMPGTYTPVFATQGLHVSLRAGAAVTGTTFATTPGVTISGLPAGQRFVLEGQGAVQALHLTGCAGDVLVDGINCSNAPGGVSTAITSCTGAVVFQQTSSATTMGIPYGTSTISNCSHVSFTGCHLPTLSITGSRISLSHSHNTNSYGSIPGIDIVSGSVVIDGGSIEGGTLYSWPWPAPGIRLGAGELVVTGGAVILHTPAYPNPWTAIETTGGTIRLDPSVQVLGPITGPATVTTGEIPSLSVSHTQTTLVVSLTGEPGSALFTLAGLPMPAMPTPWGDAWLSPLDPILDIVVLGASGASGFSYPLANVPPFAALVVQSVALSTGGALVVGAPARLLWD